MLPLKLPFYLGQYSCSNFQKKVKLSNGQIKWEQIEADYLPVAARIMWFRREHLDWSIITKAVQLANKGIVMKAIIKNTDGLLQLLERKKPKSAFQTTLRRPRQEQ